MYSGDSLFTILKTSEAIVCIRFKCRAAVFETFKRVFSDNVNTLFINLRTLSLEFFRCKSARLSDNN